MNYIFIILAFLLITIEVTYSKESCGEEKKQGRELVSQIKKNILEKKDIHQELTDLEELIGKSSGCVDYTTLKLTDNQVAELRKYKFAPSKIYNLDEASCTEINIDTSNMPKNNNQGPLAWCFAFAAADLLSFHEKKAFSAYDIAVTNHLNEKEANLDDIFNRETINAIGGHTALAMTYALELNEKGLCLEKNYLSPDIEWLKMSEAINSIASTKKGLRLLGCENNFNEQLLLHDLSGDIIKILDKLSLEKRASALMDIKCTKREKITSQNDVKFFYTKNDPIKKIELMSKLDEILTSSSPAAIGYDAEILSTGVHYTSDKSNHASTITGRRFNRRTGDCEYKIKNSWGDDDKNAPSSITFENGSYWVPRTALTNNVYNLYYMKKHN